MAREFRAAEETRARSRIVPSLIGLAMRVVEAIAREVTIRRDMRRLAEFDDHMLRDIGLARADIEGAVRRGHDDSGDRLDPRRPNPSPTFIVLPGPACRF
jgi:uncharacterized protein YjiS (DUF1127 family)